MSDCQFREGDLVSIPALGGVCGRVVARERLGTGWELKVRLPSGAVRSVSCSSVGPCSGVPRVDALNVSAEAGAEEEAAGPEDRLGEIGRAYEVVRPILVAMGDSAILRPAWRKTLQIYIQLMDSIYPKGEGR